MATFTVTTSADVVNANDGVLSLREAIAAAAASPGADTIVFDPSAFGGPAIITLGSTLTIATDVTIDGSLGLADHVTLDGGFTGSIFVDAGFTMVDVQSGVTVTIDDMTLQNGFDRGADGTNGKNGGSGLAGKNGSGPAGSPPGNPGGPGNGGASGTDATKPGTIAVAGIDNGGNLTLDQVTLVSMNAFGGNGGAGGNGGNGGNGGAGNGNNDGIGGNGGNGGDGGEGARGTDGGDAAGAIYNHGALTLIDTAISGIADGGAGGRGGAGGNGGIGGDGGEGSTDGGNGGNGGSGGNGGFSGNGGDAAGAILNAGTLVEVGLLPAFTGLETAGSGATAPAGGLGNVGNGGAGGLARGDSGVEGTPASNGLTSDPGAVADANHVLGTDGLAFAANTFIVQAGAAAVDAGATFEFAVNRLGNLAGATSVEWQISSVSASDFAGAPALSGTLAFAANQKTQLVTLTAAAGARVGNEDVHFSLTAPSAGTALGHAATADVTIRGQNHPPSSVALSADTISVDAAIGAVVGAITGADPDGDALAFALSSDPGGFFAVENDQLVLAKALDPDQHSYAIGVEASDGRGGSITSVVDIRLAGYIDGTSGNDTLTGSAGPDHIFGNGGNDVLNGGAGADTLVGGSGNDTYVVDNAHDVVSEAKGGGTDLVRASVSYRLAANVENLTLTGKAAITGVGNALANLITGNAGANHLSGGAGNDTLRGEGGNDVLDGGAGNDTYVVDNAHDIVRELKGGGTDLVRASVGYTLAANVENLTLTGRAAITGVGNTLANLVTGNAGANHLSGGAGNDTLRGEGGNDVLDGGLGKDTLTGGAGRDNFLFDSKLGAANIDRVTDFVHGHDHIELQNSVFQALTATGSLHADDFIENATGRAATTDQHIIYDKKSGALFYDADGSGSAHTIQFATLTDHPATLSHADFIVV